MSPTVFFASASVLALVYAYWNGANDRANSIATIVKTRALSYTQAVVLAGILNFLGPLVSTAVAKTIAKGIVPPELVTQAIVLGGLTGAVLWAWFATHYGIPVSITHSLVGGVAGAGIAAHGFGVLKWDILFSKILLAIAVAPAAGFLGGFFILIMLKWIMFPFRFSRYSANWFWRWGQVFSSSGLSFAHGMNDGQNAIGIMALAFFTAGFSSEIEITWWMIALGAGAIGLGTMISGYRVMRTVGWEITDLEPIDGFAAETSSAGVLALGSLLGWPMSTTHVAVAGILGAGGAKSFHAVNWKVTRGIVVAWLLTIPAAGAVGWGTYFIFSLVS